MGHYSFTDILGPVMIGPSSSHTAGAAKLALIARHINDKPFHQVTLKLMGSFAKTYKGHGTDKALIGGLLGFEADDMRLRDAYEHAKEQGITFIFEECEELNMHPNSVCIHIENDDKTTNIICGSSIGGGEIVIKAINDFKVSFKGQYPTLIIKHLDKKGILSSITTALSMNNINIATMEVSRISRNKQASIIIECDDEIPDLVMKTLRNIPDIMAVKLINVEKGDAYV